MLLPLVMVHGETGTVSSVLGLAYGEIENCQQSVLGLAYGEIDNCLQNVLLLGLAYGETGNCLKCTGFGS